MTHETPVHTGGWQLVDHAVAKQRSQINSEQQIPVLSFLLGLKDVIPVSWQSKLPYSANSMKEKTVIEKCNESKGRVDPK